MFLSNRVCLVSLTAQSCPCRIRWTRPWLAFGHSPRNLSTTPSVQKNKIVVLMSSIRPNRMGDRVAAFAKSVLAKNGMEPTLFDPLKLPFDMLRIPLHFYEKPEDAPDWLKDANKLLVNADGFLMLTTEYNSMPPPALINLLNHFPADSYRHRPCGIISYSMGQLGGYRASTLVRSIICELCMLPMGISDPNSSYPHRS